MTLRKLNLNCKTMMTRTKKSIVKRRMSRNRNSRKKKQKKLLKKSQRKNLNRKQKKSRKKKRRKKIKRKRRRKKPKSPRKKQKMTPLTRRALLVSLSTSSSCFRNLPMLSSPKSCMDKQLSEPEFDNVCITVAPSMMDLADFEGTFKLPKLV